MSMPLFGAFPIKKRAALHVRRHYFRGYSKGVYVGRKKVHPSDLIRILRRSGLSYAGIAKVTNVSQGSIGAKLKLWREELTKKNRTIADEIAAHAAERLSKSTAGAN